MSQSPDHSRASHAAQSARVREGSTEPHTATLPRSRARRRPGENRLRLLDAGIREFARFGYHGSSTTSIAKLADVPQPHVYTNFRTKLELFIACVQSAALSLMQETRLPGKTEVGVPAVDHVAASQDQARLLFQAYAALSEPQLRAEILLILNDLEAKLGERMLQELILQGAALLRDQR